MATLRELQTNLPWTIRYSRDFRSSPTTHKDFAHALHHVSKAAGKLHALADDMDHDREVADDSTLRERHAKYIADLVVCALRLANTFPGGVVDLERAVVDRIETKNAAPALPPSVDDETPRVGDLCQWIGEDIKARVTKVEGNKIWARWGRDADQDTYLMAEEVGLVERAPTHPIGLGTEPK
jgi:hypothetical protein